MLVPLGLNVCPPFHSISKVLRGASILPPARTVIEDEMRRNVFWLAYATDRTSSFASGWAYSMDDEDVAQLLPVRGDQFHKGVSTSQSSAPLLFSPSSIRISWPRIYVNGRIAKMYLWLTQWNKLMLSPFTSKEPS